MSTDLILRLRVIAIKSSIYILSLIPFQGNPGIPGTPGNPGLNCDTTLNYLTGNMLVRHSQSSNIPRCEPDEHLLWDGYSLLYLEGNEKSHHQDLGLSF